MNELNKKLAEFVWGKDNVESYFGGLVILFLRPETEKYCASWEAAPDFTDSLDACLEHLEPELYRRGLRYQLHRVHDGHVAKIFKPGRTWADMVAYAADEKLATAFCKAVEKLMEEK